MTKLFLRWFVPGGLESGDPETRLAVGRLSGGVGIGCNLVLFVLKFLAALATGSVSIIADAMNNLSDAASSVVTFVGFKLAERPADEDHPYGHARYEYLSGLAVAGLILVIGFELAKSSLEKLLNPAPVSFTLSAGLVLAAAMAVKFWLFRFNRTLGKAIGSPALEATAQDSRNDVLTTAAVLAAGIIEYYSGLAVDGWMGLGVAGFILWSGVNMARETISPLLGENASPALRQAIVDTVTREPKVLGYHDLMVHDYGPGQRFASVHVEMDHREDPLVCHEIIDNLERACMEEHRVHLVIHYDPVVTGDPELDALKARVTALLQSQDPRISIHDFRMVKSAGHTNLVFDAAVPAELLEQKKAIRQCLETDLNRDESRKYYCVITFDLAELN